MFNTILQLLDTGLKLMIGREEHYPERTRLKLQGKINEIKKRFREEDAKPRGERSNAVLDNLEFELRGVADEFRAFAERPNTGNSD